jgi:hypothetical protein
MSSRKEVNDRLTRTNIKGRQYIDVAQRIQGFWELYPQGRIVTEMVADDGKRCVFKAEAYDMAEGGAGLLATGHAYEVNSGRGVNATSYIENCETSAVGRALGMLGIGSTDSIASADEVMNAQQRQAQAAKTAPKPQQQDPLKPAKARLWHALQNYAAAHGGIADQLLEGVRSRPDARMDDPEWLEDVASEFEAAA